MDINKKLKKINEGVELMNDTIDALVITENFLIRRLAKMFIRKKIFGGDDDNGDNKDSKDDLKSYKEKLEDWRESDSKEDDISDLVDDAKETLGIGSDKEEELRELLHDIANMQKELLQDALNTKGLDKIIIKFPAPLQFEIKRGKSVGEKLKLETIKTYEVFRVEELDNSYKVYFFYKGWLREHGIMFSVEIRDVKTGRYSKSTVDIVYVTINTKNIKQSNIIEEKPLTHKANVEITTAD